MFLAALFLCLLVPDVHTACPCNGVVVQSDDQPHCWEVLPRSESTWKSADTTCQSVGGHLGHPNGTVNEKVFSYVKQHSTKPVLTGVVAANAQTNIYAIICPNDNFYGLLSSDTVFAKNATDTETCSFITSDSDLLKFGYCDADANVLCDRPMEKEDYCKIVMNCTSSTTSSVLTRPVYRNTAKYIGNSSSVATKTTTKMLNPIVVPNPPQQNVTNTNVTSTTTTTTSAKPPVQVSTPKCTGCGDHQWSIFGWCIDWRLFLVLLTIYLLTMLLFLLLHCCCKLCISPCQVKEKKEPNEEKRVDPPIPIVRKRPPIPDPGVEKSAAILPPPTTLTQPVFVPIPMNEKEHIPTKVEPEIRFITPPKPETVDVGVNTDSFWPVKKRKVKKIEKIQVRRGPPVRSPMAEVDGDLAEEISLHMDRPFSADTVLPRGDIINEIDNVPIIFTRNQRSADPNSQPNPPKWSEPIEKERTRKPFEGRQIESPPPDEQPPVLNKSPAKPPRNAELPEPRRLPSPPRIVEDAPDVPPSNSLELIIPTFSPAVNSTLGRRSGNNIPSPQISPIRKTPQDSPMMQQPRSQPSRRSENLEPMSTSPSLPRGSVSMRRARGRLGGVVRAGGGDYNGPTPAGWKPWSNKDTSQQQRLTALQCGGSHYELWTASLDRNKIRSNRRSSMLKAVLVSLLVFVAFFFNTYAEMRGKRAINPFLDSMGKRAVNPFMDSIGKRAAQYYYHHQKRYFDSLAGQSLGKRSIQLYDA
ncbi:hypothetical protein Q1695_001187 [Nippostrongylus brasiliensis]|nr:hypothetical protein Q1695_001187 [Nippostrongylus brasiliensis]